MAGHTVGRIDLEAHLDSGPLLRESEVAGREAGAAIASGVDKSWGKRFDAAVDRLRSRFSMYGTRISDAFNKTFTTRIQSALSSVQLLGQKFAVKLANGLAPIERAFVSIGNRAAAFGQTLRGIGAAGLDKVTSSFRTLQATALQTLAPITTRLLDFRDNVKSLGDSDYLRPVVKGFKDLGEGINLNLRLAGMRLREFGSNARDNLGPRTSGIFTKIGRSISSFFSFFKRGAADGTEGLEKLGKGIEDLGENSGWQSIPHNGRQAILIIAAIAAGAGPLAVLGQAAAGGLVILGGAMAAVAVGAGVLIAGFQGVMGDLSALPAQARGAAGAIQGLVGAFKGMQAPIQAALLDGLAGPIQLVTDRLIPVLQTGLVAIAGTLNAFLGNLAAALSSDEAITNFQALLSGFSGILASLGQAVISFGGALGNIFVIALPFVQQFADWLSRIGAEFLAWTQSDAGRAAITQFFENTMTVFGALEPLIGAVGDLFAALVTPQTIATTVSLLGILTQLMGPLGDFLAMVSNLQIFNILAAALQLVFAAIQPLMPSLSALALAISGPIIQAIVALIPMFQTIATAMIPFITALTDIANTVLPPLIPIIGQLGTFLGTILAAALQIITPLLSLLGPIFTQIMAVLGPLISTILPPLMQIFTALAPVVSALVTAIMALLTPILGLIQPLLQLIGPILAPLLDLLAQLASFVGAVLTPIITALTPVFSGVANTISGVLMPIVTALQGVLSGLITFLTGVFTGDWKKAWAGLSQIAISIWEGIKGAIKGAINGIVDIINGMIGAVNGVTGAIGIPAIPKIPHVAFAAGGILDRPTFLPLAGEDGPEAIVPLNRNLSRVDPSVRGLSAAAQGKSDPSFRQQPSIVIADGAIRVESPYANPRLVAGAVLDELVGAIGK